MKTYFKICLILCFGVVACNDQSVDEEQNAATSLLMKANYSTLNSSMIFEYDDDNRMIKYYYESGTEINEFYYDSNGDLSGSKQVVTYNALIPIRRFEIDVNTPYEISGYFKTYDANDVELPQHRTHYEYKLDNGLLKSFVHTLLDGSITMEKYFYHNSAGNLETYMFNINASANHIHQFKISEWDEKDNSSLFVNQLRQNMPFDLIPGIKLSTNNIVRVEQLAPNISWGTGSTLFEYNEYDQIVKMYGLTVPSYDEDGNIVSPGGEEVVFATFEYSLGN